MPRRNELQRQSVQNIYSGECGISQKGLYLTGGEAFELRLTVKSAAPVRLTAALTNETGDRIYAEQIFELAPGDWQAFCALLTPPEKRPLRHNTVHICRTDRGDLRRSISVAREPFSWYAAGRGGMPETDLPHSAALARRQLCRGIPLGRQPAAPGYAMPAIRFGNRPSADGKE